MVLQKEAKKHINVSLNITTYRHAVIAISRMHLKKCGGFKRDYGLEESPCDNQSTHTS
jgi:hypothetical protein